METFICYECVSEEYLKKIIKESGTSEKCNYCSRRRKSITLTQFSEIIEEAFERHYFRTSDQPEAWEERLMSDRESNYNFDRSGDPVIDVIAEAAGTTEVIAQHVQELLQEKYYDFEAAAMSEETEFDRESYYAFREFTGEKWEQKWGVFEKIIKTESRHFSKEGFDILTSVFHGLDILSLKRGKKPIIKAGPGEDINKLYRARVFQSDKKLEEALCYPDKYLGSPPADFASPGRMNARGISVFYGASNSAAAISEVRPPVGSKVAVAVFDIIRPLKLMDLIALSDVHPNGSIFDPNYADELERVSFLRVLATKISRPIMPDDEFLDYLITQAIADYLASDDAIECDGMIYPAIQAGEGINVILFHKAALVEPILLAEGTKMQTSLGIYSEEGWEDYITTTEIVLPERAPEKKVQKNHLFGLNLDALTAIINRDRKPALRIDVNSIIVHTIRAISFTRVQNEVIRNKHINTYQYPDNDLLSDM